MVTKKAKNQPKTSRLYFLHQKNIIGIGALICGIFLLTLFALIYRTQSTNRPFTTQPTWVQDFSYSNSTSLDPTIWHYSTDPDVPSYNNEKQGYTSQAQNVRVEPGTGLVIEAHKNTYQYPNDPLARTFEYTSGRIDTSRNLTFEYGRVEATIKIPKGRGVWPAFWLLSANEPNTAATKNKNINSADERFYMKDGEIDIMEYYSSLPGRIEATVHTYAKSYEKSLSVPDATDTFHTYAIEIEPNKITWTIDNKPYYSYSNISDDPDKWPFGNGNRMYIILNLAIGGTGGGVIDGTTAPWRMEVKNVKFYDYVF